MTENAALPLESRLEYPLEHFELQLEFARIAARVLDTPLLDALLHRTTYYRRVGARDWPSLDRADPAWAAFARRVAAGAPPAEAAFEAYARAQALAPAPPPGCFRLDYDAATRTLRVHFRNAARAERGPLAREHVGQRLRELRAVTAAAARHPEARDVAGASWLYGLHAYRRLFPPEYTRELRADAVPRLHSGSVWGQFLDSSGRVKADLAAAFLARAATATGAAGLAASVPYATYRPHCAFRHFLSFYEVSA